MPLNRAEILVQATKILDEYGLSDLSMRRLADALGVKAGAIYWHYANKQSLLAAISDQILEGIRRDELPPEEGWPTTWQAELFAWSKELRAALLEHRDAADLVSSTRAAGLGELNPMDLPTEILRTNGWPHELSAHSAGAICHFILGHVFEEQSRQQLVLLGLIDSGESPLDEAGFDHGVRVFLAGLAAIGFLHER